MASLFLIFELVLIIKITSALFPFPMMDSYKFEPTKCNGPPPPPQQTEEERFQSMEQHAVIPSKLNQLFEDKEDFYYFLARNRFLPAYKSPAITVTYLLRTLEANPSVFVQYKNAPNFLNYHISSFRYYLDDLHEYLEKLLLSNNLPPLGFEKPHHRADYTWYATIIVNLEKEDKLGLLQQPNKFIDPNAHGILPISDKYCPFDLKSLESFGKLGFEGKQRCFELREAAFCEEARKSGEAVQLGDREAETGEVAEGDRARN